MNALGKVRPNRARIADKLGLHDPKLVNKRLSEAVKAGYLDVVHKAAWGQPAQYEALLPNRPTVREIRTIQAGSSEAATVRRTRTVGPNTEDAPTVRITGDSRSRHFTDIRSSAKRDELGRYSPQITDTSKESRSVRGRDSDTESATTDAGARSHATRSAPASTSKTQRREDAASDASPPEAVSLDHSSSSSVVVSRADRRGYPTPPDAEPETANRHPAAPVRPSSSSVPVPKATDVGTDTIYDRARRTLDGIGADLSSRLLAQVQTNHPNLTTRELVIEAARLTRGAA